MWNDILGTGLPPLIAFAVTAACGVWMIPMLRRFKIGQSIKADGPSWHMHKQGIPTMGGVMFAAGILAAIVFCGFRGFIRGDWIPLLLFGFAAVCGAVGVIDDVNKIRNKRNQGITAPQKLALQMAAAALMLAALRQMEVLRPSVHVPFTDIWIEMHWIPFLTLALLFIGGFVNAVNFTDGGRDLPHRGIFFANHGGGSARRFALCRSGRRGAAGIPAVQLQPRQGVHGRHRFPVPGRCGVRAGICIRQAAGAGSGRAGLPDRNRFGDPAGRVF
jgi:hypothetical protein